MRALIKYQTRKHLLSCLCVRLSDGGTAATEQSHCGRDEGPPADEVEEEPVPKAGSPVPPVAKASTPELTESPEMVATMAVELTTARTETDALVEAIKGVSSSLENVEGQEGTSKLIKVMLLGLKAQRSIS